MRVRFMYQDRGFRMYVYGEPFKDDSLLLSQKYMREVLRERYQSISFYLGQSDKFDFKDEADTASFLLLIMPLDMCGWSAIMDL